jgi:hypothetical protein
MLDLTRVQGTYNPIELALDPTVRPLESGLAYVRGVDGNGAEVIKPAAGIGPETFVGVAYMDKIAAATGVRVGYALKVPAAGPQVVVLPDALGIVNLAIYDVTAGAAIAPADYTLSGAMVTFGNTNHANHDITVTYNYDLTEMQKAQLGISPIPSASEFIGKLAVLQGMVRCWVTNFDADAAWAIDANVTLEAGGFFGLGGSTVVGKCIHVPTAQDPFLGIAYIAG